MRHAVINKNNVVINVIVYIPGSTWQPKQDCYLIPSETANIGDWYDTASKKFFKTGNMNGTK